jgi:hypothetical protein
MYHINDFTDQFASLEALIAHTHDNMVSVDHDPMESNMLGQLVLSMAAVRQQLEDCSFLHPQEPATYISTEEGPF